MQFTIDNKENTVEQQKAQSRNPFAKSHVTRSITCSSKSSSKSSATLAAAKARARVKAVCAHATFVKRETEPMVTKRPVESTGGAHGGCSYHIEARERGCCCLG